MSLYYPLGRALRLSPEELESIRAKHLDESDAEIALNDVVLLWLHHKKYNVERFGPPTWRKLVEAVNHPLGGRNYELARKIALNHPASGKKLPIIYMYRYSNNSLWCSSTQAHTGLCLGKSKPCPGKNVPLSPTSFSWGF